jgi:phosphatidylserine decarboxylase
MHSTLLFNESPIISIIVVGAIAGMVKYKSNVGIGVFMIILIMLMVFYRYEPHYKAYPSNTVIAPTNGLVTYARQNGKLINVSIYLDIFDNHTQIYPVNGTVINRVYDCTGKFNLVNNMDKSRNNEKKIHTIKMKNNNLVKVTQIAGFFVRRITSSDKVPECVMAGDYLGMIKFGSSVDLEFPGDISKLKVKVNERISMGDIIYTYL